MKKIKNIFLRRLAVRSLYYRFKLSETPVYSQLQKNHRLESIPFIAAIKFAPYQLLKILGLTCMGSTFYYVFFAYLPTYLEHYIGFSLANALIIESFMFTSLLVSNYLPSQS